jgi:hypothetical protein
MIVLACKLCRGECDIIGNERAVHKKIKCKKCGFSNGIDRKEPEVVVLKKRVIK